MKKIGLIGGMSWQSTAAYYRIINELVHRKLGGLHSAEMILYSVDFNEIEQLQKANRWGMLPALSLRRLAVLRLRALISF